MQNTTVVIVGAGQAGLAMSQSLAQLSVEHVVLERSDVANSWRTERWDSLRLLTPNWLTRLPGGSYSGSDPDGYMTAPEVADFLESYRRSINAPVQVNTSVSSVESASDGFIVTTNQGQISCNAVVVATGACSTPRIPALSQNLPATVHQIAPIHYRNPEQLEDGPVLVVGASASGAQLAHELAASGRRVTLAVSDHVRLPRTYRGMDIHWWMDAVGILDERFDEVEDIVKARRTPSLQLVGSPDKRTLDLNSLTDVGVELVGRLAGVNNGSAQFSGSLDRACFAADLKQGRLLKLIDEFATANGLDPELSDPEVPEPTRVSVPRNVINLSTIKTVVWATGFKPNYPWLPDHVLDAKGGIVHDGGVMGQPGMYVLGLPFTRRRKSSFLDGVGPDALELSAHLHSFLDATCAVA